MNKWQTLKLRDIGKIVTGKTPRTEAFDNYGNDYMFIGPTDLHKHFIINESEKMISSKGLLSIKGSKLDGLSILVGCIGWDMGNVALVNKKCATNQQINSITEIKNSFNPFFIYYWLKNKKEYLFQIANVTRTPILNKSNFSEIELQIPSKIQQDKISNILITLDNKIELNNKINTELEAMAKTLYDYWFVQFDFPDVNGKPYKTSGGKMVWNEELKREIPKSWTAKKFSEWINNDKSGDWGKDQSEGNYTKKVYCIRGADINGLNGSGELKTPQRYILEKNSHKILEHADLIIEISGGSPVQSTGRLAYITVETLKRFNASVICSNFCKAITLKNKKLLYNFVYHWNSIYDAGVLFGYEGKTSGIKNLLFDSFVSSHYTVVPDENIIEKFNDFMEAIQTKKQKNLKENQELASLRDWLLPMLMNGQITVAN